MDALPELEPPAERPGTAFIPPNEEPDLFHDEPAETGDIPAKADPDKFNWFTDDSVLLGEQLATAVYRNRADAVVIRQEGVGGDDDHFVILRDAAAVRALVGALQREVGGGK